MQEKTKNTAENFLQYGLSYTVSFHLRLEGAQAAGTRPVCAAVSLPPSLADAAGPARSGPGLRISCAYPYALFPLSAPWKSPADQASLVRMTASWARATVPWGTRVLSPASGSRPVRTVQPMASRA